MDSPVTLPDLELFRKEARVWLEEHAEPRSSTSVDDDEGSAAWGVGSDSVAVFHAFDDAEELRRIEAQRAWQQAKFDAGYAMINWPVDQGGLGLPSSYLRAFNGEEGKFETPDAGEAFPTSLGLIATTINAFGTDEQKARFVKPLMRGDILGCQLFSEPAAGSDLASVTTKAVLDGDEWVLNGQKVWTSSARHSQWGLAVCRSNPDVPKHKGITCFLVPFDTPGVEVRPIKQMSGGANFNEVFMTDVRLDDNLRLGPVGEGWRVALTCLGFERDHSGGGGGGAVGGGYAQLVALAKHLGLNNDPLIRQELTKVFIGQRVMQYTNRRAAASLKAGQTPGPEGSLSKLMWTKGMSKTSDVVSMLLGARLTADTGEWGTYAWTEHVLGAPGYRIAGGSDEIQRNIIGERVLGLPAEPRVDKDISFAESQRNAGASRS
jgi:alkylation response protein AidB-like acyl-CoA dehydrogenase